MRRPSPRMMRNSGSITPVKFVDDPDGRRQLIPGTAGTPFKCRVHPRDSDTSDGQLREQAVSKFLVHLFSEPGDVRVHDLFNWLDYTPPRVCRITGEPQPAAGEMATWVMPVEYQSSNPPRT